MLTWFSLIWSQFQFLVVRPIDYFLGKKHIESIMCMLYALTQPKRELRSNRYGTRTTQHMHDQTTSIQSSHWVYMFFYSLAKHVSQGLWPFPDAIFNFFVEELVEDNWGKLLGLMMLTWFCLIWNQFQFLVIIDCSLGKKHIESIALCIDPTGTRVAK